jgi:predicted cupin superfamily sugar epimerase
MQKLRFERDRLFRLDELPVQAPNALDFMRRNMYRKVLPDEFPRSASDHPARSLVSVNDRSVTAIQRDALGQPVEEIGGGVEFAGENEQIRIVKCRCRGSAGRYSHLFQVSDCIAANCSHVHHEAQRLIASLRLTAHPEGGWYREGYRSVERVTTSRGTARSALTSIHFLLTGETFSAFHRLTSDEAWHFYRGTALTLEIIDPAGRHERRELGPEGPWQTVIAAGSHFAAHVEPGGYALTGCDVAPGFEFADFFLTSRAALIAAYPQHAPLIVRYTR